MCGIAGSYPNADPKNLATSLERLRHRGPDAQRLIRASRGSFAQTRLAILDVAHAHQPMNREGDWIVFNGEVYNFRKLLRLLPSPVQTESDTEAILRLYQTLGPDCVTLLDGMFAFAVLSGEELFLARDPLGIKPLYIGFKDDNLYFASELKAILNITTDIHEFPPGHWWHNKQGLQCYHPIPFGNLPRPENEMPQESDYAAIRAGLEDAVSKRLLADESVAVGVSLSGGLDSSLVSAIARRQQDRLMSFAVGTEGSQDLEMARRVAEQLGTTHFQIQYTAQDMIDALPRIIYHLESYDAALVRSAIPNYFLARLAAEHVKVILTGEGADELYAGYESLAPIQDPAALHAELVSITRKLHNTNLQRADRMGMAFGLEARVPFLDKAFVRKSLNLPARWKLQKKGRPEKALLRKAFTGLLPENVLFRKKQKFSSGAGSMNLLTDYAREKISEGDMMDARQSAPWKPRSREETLYYRIFARQFGDELDGSLIGRSETVTATELA
ncbi:MAG: asparagine synthase B [Chloroflexi bacterium]|nr:asparagine synthase B [Chloroflexota bacterium]